MLRSILNSGPHATSSLSCYTCSESVKQLLIILQLCITQRSAHSRSRGELIETSVL